MKALKKQMKPSNGGYKMPKGLQPLESDNVDRYNSDYVEKDNDTAHERYMQALRKMLRE
jgi:hypothetical protein